MTSEARGYEAGAEVWRIVHNPDKGESVYHLDISGQLPPDFEDIRREIIARQDEDGGEDAGCDHVFDVPADVAKVICGFKFGDTEPFDPEFREICKVWPARGPKGPGLLQRLFGRKQPVA